VFVVCQVSSTGVACCQGKPDKQDVTITMRVCFDIESVHLLCAGEGAAASLWDAEGVQPGDGQAHRQLQGARCGVSHLSGMHTCWPWLLWVTAFSGLRVCAYVKLAETCASMPLCSLRLEQGCMTSGACCARCAGARSLRRYASPSLLRSPCVATPHPHF